MDEFRNYPEKRGDNAKDTASTAQAQGKTSRREATDTHPVTVVTKKGALADALGDLNRPIDQSVAAKFDPTDKWMEAKGAVEGVVDDARKINK